MRDHNQTLARTYPSIQIEFNPQDLPADILSSLQQAIICHAEQCYVAAAIMIRRSLEELCEHQRATGKDLKDRIKALSSKVILPPQLLDAMDDLRLLGNDAAHVEAKTYQNIGKDEVEAGIELAKEVLKAVYQLSSLVDKLKALKKTP